MDNHGTIARLFGAPRALIGVIHVSALPGTPGARLGIDAIVNAAVDEARIYHEAGFDAVLIENMHDRPYLPRSAGPEIVAAMAVVASTVRQDVGMPLGVQVLAGANQAALAVAHASNACFVRVEGFVFAHVADEGLLAADAGELLRYRRAIGAEDIHVFADIKKKHSSHALTADVSLAETARAAEFFRADGVVVSGLATGRPTEPSDVRAVTSAVSIPTLVGSGVAPDNIASCAPADAFIVGSFVKRDGLWSNPLDPARVLALKEAFDALPAR